MLELLFRGFFEWIYGLILECWEYFSSVLFDLMSLDFAYLETNMPIITTIRQIMLGVGWALLLGNLVFQATRSMMAGVGFEADDPKLLFTRTFVFSFLLVASPQICDICLNMTSVIIDMVQMPDAAAIKLPDEGFFVDLTASWLLVIVFGLIVMFQTCKLFFEMAERYFILAVLTITAPLAFGVGGSRSTSDIFSGWCRMYGSMCLLMVMNVVFVKMLLSILSFPPQWDSGITMDRDGAYRSQGSQEERCHHHADRVEPRYYRRLSGAFLPRRADLYGGANDGLPCCADRRQEHCRRKNRRTDADQIRQQARKQARQRRTLLWWRQHSQHLCRQQTFRAAVRQLAASD